MKLNAAKECSPLFSSARLRLSLHLNLNRIHKNLVYYRSRLISNFNIVLRND